MSSITNQTATAALYKAISSKGNLDEVQQLIEQRADVNAFSVPDSSEKVQQLIDQGDNESARRLVLRRLHGHDDETPLFKATRVDRVDMMEALIRAKADVNAKSSKHFTPLMCAIGMKSDKAIGLLLDSQADPNLRPNKSYPLVYAIISQNSLSSLNKLINAKADVNMTRDELDRTPLYLASIKGMSEHVQALTNANADIDPFNRSGVTPLQLAIKTNKRIAAAVLIKNGANLRAKREGDEKSAFFKLPQEIREHADVKWVDSKQVTASKLLPIFRLFLDPDRKN